MDHLQLRINRKSYSRCYVIIIIVHVSIIIIMTFIVVIYCRTNKLTHKQTNNGTKIEIAESCQIQIHICLVFCCSCLWSNIGGGYFWSVVVTTTTTKTTTTTFNTLNIGCISFFLCADPYI